MSGTAESLFKLATLTPHGPVLWGEPIPSHRPGVYVVEAPAASWSPFFDISALEVWVARVPGMQIDGVPADATALRQRLDTFWITSETVVYIGRAGRDVGRRVRDYYRTPLGDPRPHAGGHWLKTLSDLDQFRVWWAETDDPTEAEARLLWAFAEQHDVGFLPFANRQDAAGQRKEHGISHSTIPTRPGPSGARTSSLAEPKRSALTRAITRIDGINEALQRFACADARGEVTAVEAAAELDRLGLLRDSANRPGLPLRRLLRDGRIAHARQDNGRRWFIQCGHR